MPRRLGQHFLADASWRARIIERMRPQPDQVWLEIGAGHGEMTRELASRAKFVFANELDPPLVERLRGLAAEAGNIGVIAGDVLALDLQQSARNVVGVDLRQVWVSDAQGTRPQLLQVYGSLPYYITSPILRRLFEHADWLEAIFVVIQFEVAARLVARPGRRDYGFLSVLTQYFSEPEICFRIPPGAFRPPPKVASALVRLAIRHPERGGRAHQGDAAREREFLRFAGLCFEQKRKTLLNNLKADYGAEPVQAALRACGLKPSARAEELSVEKLQALFRALTA